MRFSIIILVIFATASTWSPAGLTNDWSKAPRVDPDQLIAQSFETRPERQIEAARLMKFLVYNFPRVRKRLTAMAFDRTLLGQVRSAAIMSIGLHNHAQNAQSLLAISNDPSEYLGVRIEATKALFYAAHWNQFGNPRGYLLELLHSKAIPEVRKAAAWGLFDSVQKDVYTQRALLQVGTNSQERTSLRVQALRSLFSAWQNPNQRWLPNQFARIVDNENEEEPVRAIAASLLQGYNEQGWVMDFLYRICNPKQKGVRYPESVQEAARAAMVSVNKYRITLPQVDEIADRFHISHIFTFAYDPFEARPQNPGAPRSKEEMQLFRLRQNGRGAQKDSIFE